MRFLRTNPLEIATARTPSIPVPCLVFPQSACIIDVAEYAVVSPFLPDPTNLSTLRVWVPVTRSGSVGVGQEATKGHVAMLERNENKRLFHSKWKIAKMERENKQTTSSALAGWLSWLDEGQGTYNSQLMNASGQWNNKSVFSSRSLSKSVIFFKKTVHIPADGHFRD